MSNPAQNPSAVVTGAMDTIFGISVPVGVSASMTEFAKVTVPVAVPLAVPSLVTSTILTSEAGAGVGSYFWLQNF